MDIVSQSTLPCYIIIYINTCVCEEKKSDNKKSPKDDPCQFPHCLTVLITSTGEVRCDTTHFKDSLIKDRAQDHEIKWSEKHLQEQILPLGWSSFDSLVHIHEKRHENNLLAFIHVSFETPKYSTSRDLHIINSGEEIQHTSSMWFDTAQHSVRQNLLPRATLMHLRLCIHTFMFNEILSMHCTQCAHRYKSAEDMLLSWTSL